MSKKNKKKEFVEKISLESIMAEKKAKEEKSGCKYNSASIYGIIGRKLEFDIEFDFDKMGSDDTFDISGDAEIEEMYPEITKSREYDCDIYSFWSTLKFSQLDEFLEAISEFGRVRFALEFEKGFAKEVQMNNTLADFENFADAVIAMQKKEKTDDFDR